MPLEPGSTLGVYQVTGQTGACGIGEARKARVARSSSCMRIESPIGNGIGIQKDG